MNGAKISNAGTIWLGSTALTLTAGSELNNGSTGAVIGDESALIEGDGIVENDGGSVGVHVETSDAIGVYYTVTFTVDSGRGSVEPSSLSIEWGTTWTASGDTITFTKGTTVQTATAVPASSSSAKYAFSAWSAESGTVKWAETISASFTEDTSSDDGDDGDDRRQGITTTQKSGGSSSRDLLVVAAAGTAAALLALYIAFQYRRD